MGLVKDILRVLGLTKDARVHISAPDVEVVLTGNPEQVRALLSVVRAELERNPRYHARREPAAGSERLVRPSELDETDSPYALPEARVVPVNDGRTSGTSAGPLVASSSDVAETLLPEPDTQDDPPQAELSGSERPPPAPRREDLDDRPTPEVVKVHRALGGVVHAAVPGPRRKEAEQVTVEVESAREMAPARPARPELPAFTVDAGPTLTPSSDDDLRAEVEDD